MGYAKLIERLRLRNQWGFINDVDADKAADAIESQAKRIAELEAAQAQAVPDGFVRCEAITDKAIKVVFDSEECADNFYTLLTAAPTPAKENEQPPLHVIEKSYISWHEDYAHENGKYINRCVDCGELFMGHKRRVLCKACCTTPAAGQQSTDRWRPDYCPITGFRFFMWLDHPELGYVPTYGGPFDSYTIPEIDDDGYPRSEHYDHDRGEWIEGGAPMNVRNELTLTVDVKQPPTANAAQDWKTVNQVVSKYIDEYVLDDAEVYHEPTEFEKLLIVDAIHGLLSSADFVAAFKPNAAQDVRNQALEEAAKICRDVTNDWDKDGQVLKGHAGAYLEHKIRSMKTPAKREG